MSSFQPYLFQLIILISTGLSMIAFAQNSLKGTVRAIGVSRWPAVVMLAFSPWLLKYSPQSVCLFFAELLCLVYLYYYEYLEKKGFAPRLNLFTLLIPFISLAFLIYQPKMANFAYDNVIITGLTIGFAVLILIYKLIRKSDRILLFYLFFQTLGLTVIGVNYSQVTLITGLSILLISEFYALSQVLSSLSHQQLELYEENRQYREDFESAVEKEVKKRTFYMELTKERMLQINRTDHLTKLLNRKSIMADIDDLILDKNVQKFVLFIFDLDHFKQINDTLGHATGDVCLKNLAAVVKSQIGENDLSGRYGGDEFIIALPNRGYKEGLTFAESLMLEISKQNNPPFTISMGMAVYPWDGETYRQLFEIADKGLYAAKEQGRKRLGYKGYIRP